MALSLGLLGCIVGPALLLVTGVARPVDASVAGGMAFAAVLVATQQPRALPALVLSYAVWNRLIRRLLDYAAQDFSGTPPTSLVVPALCLIMGAAALIRWKTLPRSIRRGAPYYFGALAYGAVVGVPLGASMAFELLNWLAPLGFGLYLAWLRPTPAEIHRLVRTLAIVVSLAMAYAWVQWTLLPPWDEFWVRHCGMGSIGLPRPMLCRMFGPFGEHGGAGAYSATTALLLVVFPCLPAPLRYGLAVFLGVSSLATGVRAAWIPALAGLVTWIAVRRSGGGVKVLVPLTLAFAAGAFILPSLPGSNFAMKRVGTLGNLANDSSLKGRLAFTAWALSEAIGEPIGHGMGSTGLAAMRLGGDADVGAFDSGFTQPLFALGIPGSVLLCVGLWRLAAPLMRRRSWSSSSAANVADFAKAMILSGLVSMIVFNFLKTEAAFFFWTFVLTTHTLRQEETQRRPAVRRELPYGVPPAPPQGAWP